MNASMAKWWMTKRSISLAVLAVTIAGCSVVEDINNESGQAPGSTVFAEPYEAVLLDGSTMTISQGNSALNNFAEGLPTAIHSLNLLAQSGDCYEIKDHAESWTAQVGDTEDGRLASAYAKHADNIYRYIECGKAARPVQAVETQGEIRYDTCREALDADGGNYLFGIDPEYSWYEDRDGDGVVCESR